MSLPNIDSAGLFDVRGKSAIIVGATGAFGKVACATLGSAGARLTIAAGKAARFTNPRSGTCRERTFRSTRWLRGRTPRRPRESIVQGRSPRMAAWIFWSLPRE
jgi:NAD(P)-dependent dehydrogenase (short-subunit alcohol dehydrogenase family)